MLRCPADQRAMLWLQRLAGNAAVSRLPGMKPLGGGRTSARVPVSVQRFVGSEHKSIGDSTGRSVDLGNGVVLSWGDIVALAGDQYATLDDLLADTKDDEGKQRLRAAIEKDEIASAALGGLPAPTKDQKSAQNATYLKLAADNASHFDADAAAVNQWQAEHATAIADALDAGLTGDEAKKSMADAREAFAEHFLTDSFSGGHIRVPRADIIGWYRTNFAPKVADNFVRTMRDRLVDAITAQVSPQTSLPDFIIRSHVADAVDGKLAAGIAKIGGHEQLVDYFALAVAGAVSGALHDLEGARGVMVTSEAHPQPWRAYGDAQLNDSPESEEQAQLAVQTAAGQIDKAYAIGSQYKHDADPASAPAVTYFAFDSAALSPAGSTEAAAAAQYLRLHPEIQVTLTGNTDPTGTNDYNYDLGLRRANSVAQELLAGGVPQDQIVVRSDGETNLVSTAPGSYKLDRRVTYTFASRPGPYIDPVRDEAVAKAQAELGPPFNEVTRYVPHPVDAPVASPEGQISSSPDEQVELEEWRWGSIPPTLRSQIDAWVREKVGPATSDLASNPDLAPRTVEGFDVQPLPVLQGFVDDLMKDPSKYLENAFGQPMSPGTFPEVR